MSFHIEWERLARQAWDQIPDASRLVVAAGLVRLMHAGIPDDAEPGDRPRPSAGPPRSYGLPERTAGMSPTPAAIRRTTPPPAPPGRIRTYGRVVGEGCRGARESTMTTT
jgi:hypothetical protein